jgi:tetratricopeptide (TPR) repeat protein
MIAIVQMCQSGMETYQTIPAAEALSYPVAPDEHEFNTLENLMTEEFETPTIGRRRSSGGLGSLSKTLQSFNPYTMFKVSRHRKADMVLSLVLQAKQLQRWIDPLKLFLKIIMANILTIPTLPLYLIELFFKESNKIDEALKIQLAALKKVTGQNTRLEYAILSEVGLLSVMNKQYKEAETFLKKAIPGLVKILGSNSKCTLRVRCWLGQALLSQEQDRYDEGMQEFRGAIAIQDKVIGQNSRETLVWVCTLGVTLDELGLHAEAEVYLRRSLIGCENGFGESSIDTIWSVYNLGICLFGQKRYCEAETMQRRALSEKENSTSATKRMLSIANTGSH